MYRQRRKFGNAFRLTTHRCSWYTRTTLGINAIIFILFTADIWLRSLQVSAGIQRINCVTHLGNNMCECVCVCETHIGRLRSNLFSWEQLFSRFVRVPDYHTHKAYIWGVSNSVALPRPHNEYSNTPPHMNTGTVAYSSTGNHSPTFRVDQDSRRWPRHNCDDHHSALGLWSDCLHWVEVVKCSCSEFSIILKRVRTNVPEIWFISFLLDELFVLQLSIDQKSLPRRRTLR